MGVIKVTLESLFSPFGEIEEALVIADKDGRGSGGFGFVTYKKMQMLIKPSKRWMIKRLREEKLL